MPYRHIDQLGRDGVRTDRPYGAASMERYQKNLEALALDRAPATALAVCADSGSDTWNHLRLCSPWPIAWGPFRDHVGADEVAQTLSLSFRLTGVEWSIDGTGLPPSPGTLIRLHATCCGVGSDDYDRPPRDAIDWDLQLSATTTDAVITLTAPTHSRRGPVGVLLWTWSVISDSSEATGAVMELLPFGVLGLDITSGSVSVNAENRRPERVLRIFNTVDSSGQSIETAGPNRLIGYYDAAGLSTGYDAVAHLAPPFGDIIEAAAWNDSTVGANFNIHTMGVVALTGISVEAAPRYNGPLQHAFAPDVPARDGPVKQLVSELNRLSGGRMRTWGAGKGQPRDAQLWGGRTNVTRLDTAWQRLHPLTWFIASPPPADNGFRVLVELLGWFSDDANVHQDIGDTPFDVRLAAYTAAIPSTTLQQGGAAHERRVAIIPHFEIGGRWLALSQTFWKLQLHGDWQLRGGYVTELVPGVTREQSDWGRVSRIEFDHRDTGSLVYPVVMAVEVRLRGGTSSGPDASLYPLTATLWARGLDEVAA